MLDIDNDVQMWNEWMDALSGEDAKAVLRNMFAAVMMHRQDATARALWRQVKVHAEYRMGHPTQGGQHG